MVNVKGPVAELWKKFKADVYPDLDETNPEDEMLLDTLQEAYYCGALSLFSLFHESFEIGDHEASTDMLDAIGTDLDSWSEQIADLAQAETESH